ncbi:extracellular serine/threonine protein kinase FAM20C [Aplysia californica]|uniref:Extracellular serine/threonine protein kinase FAM20C n=1 Tax=Aplysia californica TaxID=6500 RepID=A0ABM1VQU5_APLCA|nr:extracellular serine/threonine protein kinase FAM20C [Aplysia californica]
MWPVLRRRWRTLLWLLLLGIIVLNVAVFVGVPGVVKGGGSNPKRAVGERDYSHLQVIRKRLNKSFSNSSSLHQPDPDARQDAQDPAVGHVDDADDNFMDDHLAPKLSAGNFADGYRRSPEEEQGGPLAKVNPIREGPAVKRNGGGFGSRANYSLPDVDGFIRVFEYKYSLSPYNVGNMSTSYQDVLQATDKLKRKGARLRAYVNNRGVKSWERFHYGIREHYLYDSKDVYINKLLNDMATKEIIDVEQKEGGTQIKLIITFEDEGQALFKPMRFSREQETLPDHFYFADYERHNAEIAAFHLDRYIVGPATLPFLAYYFISPPLGRQTHGPERKKNRKLVVTTWKSPAGNMCFHGSCSYYCDSSHPICGHPWMLEGSLAAFLPPFTMAKRKTWRNPWKRSYSKHRKAYWEVYNDLCEKVKLKHPYSEGRRLLDVLDMSVFDFLTGNLDRHHYETFREFGNDTFLLHLDNGRAFGKSKYDCISCLAPVRQCCMIRLSTLTKLVKLYQGPQSLSSILRESMAADPINPILMEPHLDALDRRLSKILHVISGCIKDGRAWGDVVIDDGVT